MKLPGRPPSPPKKRDPAARWTSKLVKNGWTPISDDFLAHYTDLVPAITSTEAMLIVHLMQHKWDGKAPYPGFETLAKRMGMTATAVRNHARSLEKKGYLQREPRVSQTNRFHLDGLFRKLEAFIETKPPKPKRSKFEIDLSAFD